MLCDMNIYLIGYRCTGKTTIGRALASVMRFCFNDTDKEIEKQQYASIEYVVEKSGREQFRKIEKQVLLETKKLNGYVIATGGCSVTSNANIEFMKTHGVVIWLKASVDTIKMRMAKDPLSSGLRPSLTGSTIDDEIASVLTDRLPFYEKACDFAFDTSLLSPEEIAKNIVLKIQTEEFYPE